MTDDKTRNDFILDYRQLISSLEDQKRNANIPLVNYHKFLLEQENFFNFKKEINHTCSEPNKVKWKLSEVNLFFTALQRCGKHNPVEISRRIKTKTPLQVMVYIEQLENELQYAKEIGRIKKEPLDYKDILAAREMSEEWAKFEDKSAKMLIQKLEESEENRKNAFNPAANEFNELKQDREKIELFKLENIAKSCFGKLDMKDKELSSHVLCSFHDVLRGWLTIVIHDLIILNQHHKRLYPQENTKHLITVQDIRKVLRFRDYNIRGDLQENINPAFSQRNNPKEDYLQVRNFLSYDNNQRDESTDSDVYFKIEDNENEDEEMEDMQVEEYAKQKEQFHKLVSIESTIDKLYEKALVKLLCEQNQFEKLQEEVSKLETISYYATMWNDYINNVKLDKVLQKNGTYDSDPDHIY